MVIPEIAALIQGVFVVQAAFNVSLFPRLQFNGSSGIPVSVCLPMRNEIENCERIIREIFDQGEFEGEVLVLDDESDDGTSEILRALQREFSQLRIVAGKPKPQDWRGKVWALSQLARHATHETLIFLDADVRVGEAAIAVLVSHYTLRHFDHFSVFPHQITTPKTELLVNHIYTTLLHLLPFEFVGVRVFKGAIAGCGQVQIISKSALNEIGGYASLKGSLHDGLHTARKIKAAGLRSGFASGDDFFGCRMYSNFKEAWSGFSRNAHQAAGSVFALAVTASILIALFIAAPLFAVASGSIGLAVTSGLLYLSYARICHRFRLRPQFLLRLPISILVSTAMQIRSFFGRSGKREILWRGRTV
jgi:cellulose synthase/poly-beta-1,6-N-acetylglucosamine synthase-like glycosyltransferase